MEDQGTRQARLRGMISTKVPQLGDKLQGNAVSIATAFITRVTESHEALDLLQNPDKTLLSRLMLLDGFGML